MKARSLLFGFLIGFIFSFSAVAFADDVNTVQTNISNAIQDSDAFSKDAEVVFSYQPGTLYRIHCTPGYLTDVRLAPGEEITFIGGGDTTRWIIDQAKTGGTSHLYIKPVKTDMTTNLIVNTNRHSYQILLTATDWYNPMISWSYPIEENLKLQVNQEKIEKSYIQKGFAGVSLDQLNFGYKIQDKEYSWRPAMVFDDGQKTYIKMPDAVKTMDSPVVFIRENKVMSLVNYRVKGNLYILDRLFDEAELRVNQNEVIKIKRKKGDQSNDFQQDMNQYQYIQ